MMLLNATRLLAASLVAVLASNTARSQCLLGASATTLSEDASHADLIVFGTLKKTTTGANSTDLHIESVFKKHPFLGERKVLTLPRAVAIAADTKYIVYINVFPTANSVAAAALTSGLGLNNIQSYSFDAYRGDVVAPDGKLAAYVKGALAVQRKDVPTRMIYFVDHLDAGDAEISEDAFMEIAKAEYKHVRAAFATVPAAKLTALLSDKKTPRQRIGLYGVMLGHAGTKESAALLRTMIDDAPKRRNAGLDGLLTGYVLLDPTAGWDYLLATAKDPSQNFEVRYASLKTMRFFWENRPDVVKKVQILDGYKALLAHDDIADLPIQDLRRWKCHDLTPDILALGRKPEMRKNAFVYRTIVQYALTTAGKDPAAAHFVAEVRKDNPERVKMIEAALHAETAK